MGKKWMLIEQFLGLLLQLVLTLPLALCLLHTCIMNDTLDTS